MPAAHTPTVHEQVLLSAPPSPMSPVSSEDEAATQRDMVSGATGSNRKNDCDDVGRCHHRTFVNRKPKFPTKYHELLQPLNPVVITPGFRPEPPPLARREETPDGVKGHLQEELMRLLLSRNGGGGGGGDLEDALGRFLRAHSENVDVNRLSPDGEAPAHVACARGDLPALRTLLRHGADLALANRDGFCPLHLASFRGDSELLAFVVRHSSSSSAATADTADKAL